MGPGCFSQHANAWDYPEGPAANRAVLEKPLGHGRSFATVGTELKDSRLAGESTPEGFQKVLHGSRTSSAGANADVQLPVRPGVGQRHHQYVQ